MGRHSAPENSGRKVVKIVAPVAAVALAAGGVYAVANGSDEGSSRATAAPGDRCAQPTHVSVAAPAEISATVRALTKDLATRPGTCIAYEVVDRDAQTAARGIAVAAGDAPQIWVTDSPLWVDRVNQTLTKTPLVPSASIATTPVGIAVPAPLAATGQIPTGSQSFVRLLSASGGRLPMRVADPETSASTLIGTTAAMAFTGGNQEASLALARTMVGLSHSWSTDAELQLLAGSGSADATLFPATEQQMHSLNKTFPQAPVKAIRLAEGDPMLDYRVVPVTNRTAPSAQAVSALTAALTSPEGVKALQAAGFRAGGSTGPGVDGMSGSPAKPVPLTLDQVDTTVRVTDAVGLDINLLTVIDTTGSMRRPAVGGLNRIQAATQAVQKAVSLFPTQTRFGLWEFAAGINGPKDKRNYKEILPIQPLSTKVGPVTQQQAALAALQEMPKHVKGGTPLYDTILAAYQASQAKHQQNSTSAMVVVTDGKDEDYAGIDLQGLISRLERLEDPKRPVKVILVGIGQEADMPTLRAIAKATGGAAYNASNPADIPNVVFDALAQRVTVATEL